jgi:hypothetical protein
MPTLTVNLDERAEAQLARLSADAGPPTSEAASRLLRHALRDQRPRPAVDREAVRHCAAEFAEEDVALAESDAEHRADLLRAEDDAQ